jgi:DNA helicase HerA-like ATPase
MIDFHGDMSPDKTVVQTYDIHEASQYYFNPLEIDTKFPDITPLRAEYDFLDAMLINFPNLGIQQRDNIADIIEQGYKQQGITISPDTWSNELPFAFIQNEILNSDDKERQSLSAYFRGIFDYQLFSGTKKFSVGEVLNVGISHINLKLLPESLRALYADLFLRKLYYTLQTLGEIPRGDIPDNQRYRIFVIVDEAKLLVSERQGVKAVLNKYATEMRKCGVGLILASQLVSHFNDEILANIASKICMNAENMNQAKTNGKLFDIPEKVLINLEPGQCYLKTKAGLTELQVSPSWKR